MISEWNPVLHERSLVVDQPDFHPLFDKTPKAIWYAEHLFDDEVAEIVPELNSVCRKRPIA